jgi:hypothetical protein
VILPFEEAMRSGNSSKWLMDMEDEMIATSTNYIWEQVEIPKGAKIVGSKRVYKMNYV